MIYFDPEYARRVVGIRQKLGEAGENVPELVAQGLVELAERILERAKMRDLMPYKTGELHDSGSVDVSNRDMTSGRFKTVARIVFTAPHAAIQHNDTSLKHPNGGGPFFLRRAADEFVGPRGMSVIVGVIGGRSLVGQVG